MAEKYKLEVKNLVKKLPNTLLLTKIIKGLNQVIQAFSFFREVVEKVDF